MTAYPETRAALDYAKLQLCKFEPGALVRYRGAFHRFADPWRRPQYLFPTALSPVATLTDKLRVASFRKYTTRGTLEDLYQRPEQTTLELLQGRGFSDTIIRRFFQPFLGGVFLDRSLQTSSRMCEFVFRMFSLGDAAVPAGGMAAIPRQLAEALPADAISTNCRVDRINGTSAVTMDGQQIAAKSLVIATEKPAAQRLLGNAEPAPGNRVLCLYFAADESPIREPILVLNGEGEGPINNLCVPSRLDPSVAPPGKSLVSVSVLDEQATSDNDVLTERVRTQLASWFGGAVEAWQHLRTYDIPFALPNQSPPALDPVAKPTTVSDGVFVCGDHCDTASINGAMASGRRAAEAVESHLSVRESQDG